jgi:prephenate dehydrogenase
MTRIAIVGVGLIGGSVGLAVRARGFGRVVVFDALPGVAQRAVALGAADEAASSFEEAVSGAELVVLAVPPAQILALLPTLAKNLAPRAVATDVGSVKMPIAEAAQEFLPRNFVPSHPMAGKETHGLGSADGSLFQGATWAITPLETSDPEAVSCVGKFVVGLGARPLLLSPERHDAIVAVTSHAPHALAYALSALARTRAETEPELFALAAGGFHSTTRVAASDPALWTQICLANRESVLDVLRELTGRLEATVDALERADADALEALFTAGRRV